MPSVSDGARARPAQGLEELLECADPAGKGEEGGRLVGHHGLALVHVGHDVQLGQPVVRDLLGRQRLGDHADRPAPRLEHRVGDDAHQADPAAAVDQANPARPRPRPPARRPRRNPDYVPDDEPQ